MRLCARGGQMDDPFPDKTVETAADNALHSGRLFLASGAPFGRLFSLVDAVVLHGGLGTTSEVLQAKLPAIVTGVLLLDQRFWGSRCKEMEVGPFGVHVDDFPDVCVEYVNKALEDGSVWRENASKIGSMLIEEAGDDPSGVRRNVECVVRMSELAKPYFYRRDDDNSEVMSTSTVGKLLLQEAVESLKKEKQEKPDAHEKDKLNPDEVLDREGSSRPWKSLVVEGSSRPWDSSRQPGAPLDNQECAPNEEKHDVHEKDNRSPDEVPDEVLD